MSLMQRRLEMETLSYDSSGAHIYVRCKFEDKEPLIPGTSRRGHSCDLGCMLVGI